MCRRFLMPAVLASLTCAAAAPAAAGDFLGGSWRASAGAASDYVFRGRSQNDEDIGVTGNIDYEHGSGLFAGMDAATVDFGGGEDAALRFYGGHTGEIDTLFYVLRGSYTSYAGGPGGLGYGEVEGMLGVDYGFLLLRGGAAWSPDFFAGSGDGVYVFSNADFLIPLGWPVSVSLNGEIGYQGISDAAAFGADDYYTWNAGLTFSYKRFDLDLRYHDSTIANAGSGQDAGARFVAGLKLYF